MDLVLEWPPVLLLLYVVDSMLFVRSGELAFACAWGGSFGESPPGLRFPGLSPIAEVYLTSALPLRVCTDGVWVRARHGRTRLVRFEEMQGVRERDGEVRLLAGAVLPVRPRALAPAVARIVERLRTTAPSRRLARLRRELRPRCDTGALLALRAQQARRLPALKALSAASAFAMAVALPASLVIELPARPSPFATAIAVALLYLATIVVSAWMLRDCGLSRRRVASAVLPLALFPPAVAHAPSIVGRELLLGFEPLAVGAALLPAGGLGRLMRGVGLRPGQGDEGCFDLEALVGTLVRKVSARVRGPRPRPSDAAAAAFCPSCLAEYRAGYERCSDCDVALEPFERR